MSRQAIPGLELRTRNIADDLLGRRGRYRYEGQGLLVLKEDEVIEWPGQKLGNRSVGEWANWITVTTRPVGVQIGRNTICFNIKKHSPIYIIYKYEMECGLTRSKCQANKAPRVVIALESLNPTNRTRGWAPPELKIRYALTNLIHPTLRFLHLQTYHCINLYIYIYIKPLRNPNPTE